MLALATVLGANRASMRARRAPPDTCWLLIDHSRILKRAAGSTGTGATQQYSCSRHDSHSCIAVQLYHRLILPEQQLYCRAGIRTGSAVYGTRM